MAKPQSKLIKKPIQVGIRKRMMILSRIPWQFNHHYGIPDMIGTKLDQLDHSVKAKFRGPLDY